ncbi:hypothetical protein RB195_017249 [Necator americanus]|uniref:Uncharacterized protein n=1 Tax=Necator americanus TaxID=51031 RepID=A0ABR1C6E7_NECAM
MGNSQSYDVTNVSSREAKRQEKTGSVKPLQDDLPPRILESNEHEKAENKAPTEHGAHHDEHHIEHHKSHAPEPPIEPAVVVVSHEEKKSNPEIGDGVNVTDLELLYRVEEPDAIPVDAFPAQSRYD